MTPETKAVCDLGARLAEKVIAESRGSREAIADCERRVREAQRTAQHVLGLSVPRCYTCGTVLPCDGECQEDHSDCYEE